MNKKTIRVLCIDDSALVRQILSQGLDMDPGIEVIATAPDVFIGRDKIVKLKPDVVTLDVEMPKMDGVEFLRRLMPQWPVPVIMVSSLTEKGKRITLDALEFGAVDIVAKPKGDIHRSLNLMMTELRTKIKIASTANVSHWKTQRNKTYQSVKPLRPLKGSTDKVIAIGASTGGTVAIEKILKRLPTSTPGFVIVQHMPEGFTKLFADRMNDNCDLYVKEAQTGDRIMAGKVLIAPGSKHMKVQRSGGIYEVICSPGPDVRGHCPSVEVMMNSVAKHVGSNALGVMLTGMGRDGADAMLKMRQSGSRTLAQDEASCIVFGMPNEAYINGGAEKAGFFRTYAE